MFLKRFWNFFFFFFFFFLKFLKKKALRLPKKALLLPNLAKKTPKTNPRPKCIGGFHYRRNLQKIVSMPFGKGNYVFKTILKKNFFFFFFFFLKFLKKKSTPAPAH